MHVTFLDDKAFATSFKNDYYLEKHPSGDTSVSLDHKFILKTNLLDEQVKLDQEDSEKPSMQYMATTNEELISDTFLSKLLQKQDLKYLNIPFLQHMITGEMQQYKRKRNI